MRYLCVLLVVIATPLQASAQERRPTSPQSIFDAVGLPLPAIGLPPPAPSPRSRTLAPSVPAWEIPRVPAWERQGPPPWERPRISQPIHPGKPTRSGRPDHDRRRHKADVVFVPYAAYGYNSGLPYYMGPATATPAPAPAPAPPPPSDTGYLRLEVEPAALLQIYVDGVFVGTPADIGGDLELRTGAHQIELRAPGYDSVTFNARIEADRGITYRAALRSIEARPAAPVILPTGSKTLYVIPGCYLGNVMPDASRLREGCDISQMKTHTP